MNTTEKATLAALSDISGIGDARAYELYEYFDDPSAFPGSPDTLMNEFHYVDSEIYSALQSLDENINTYCREFEKYEAEGIIILGVEDDRYPEPVRNGPAPVLLYLKGNTELLNEQTVGVSGSRETNETGMEWIQSLASDLVQTGYTVVSGGAQGADTAAHTGAVESAGSTIVVLGTGVNIAYPPENESLFNQIVETDGLIISMQPPDTEPTRHSFLHRNELIAALSEAMIFVAADPEGGTMAQYEMAIKQNRPVFVPPADLEIQPSEGLSDLREAKETLVIHSETNLSNIVESTNSGISQTSLDSWS